MVDYNAITTRIFGGGQISNQQDMDDFLKTTNVTHILNLEAEVDNAPLLVSHPNIKYLWLGTADDHNNKPTSWYKGILDFTLETLQSPSGKIYLHCAAGISRSAAALYFVFRYLGFTSIETKTIINTKRPQMLFFYTASAEDALQELGYE